MHFVHGVAAQPLIYVGMAPYDVGHHEYVGARLTSVPGAQVLQLVHGVAAQAPTCAGTAPYVMGHHGYVGARLTWCNGAQVLQ